jgi:hypothetical protein
MVQHWNPLHTRLKMINFDLFDIHLFYLILVYQVWSSSTTAYGSFVSFLLSIWFSFKQTDTQINLKDVSILHDTKLCIYKYDWSWNDLVAHSVSDRYNELPWSTNIQVWQKLRKSNHYNWLIIGTNKYRFYVQHVQIIFKWYKKKMNWLSKIFN